jgi:hypothetical protein
MRFSTLTTVALAFTAIGLCAPSAFADTIREVKCANGKTVQASGTQSPAAACRVIGSRPHGDTKNAGNEHEVEYDLVAGKAAATPRTPANDAKARKYQRLAAMHKPKSAQQEQLIKQYMKLPPTQRLGFKAEHPGVQKSIWDYGPYAVCFYASVAGGADVVEAGDECHEDWVN